VAYTYAYTHTHNTQTVAYLMQVK